MKPVVFDTSALSCFARAGLLPLLEQITAGRSRHAPRAVLEELRQGASEYPELLDALNLPWLEEARLDDSLAALGFFAEIARRIAVGERNVGEASAIAWAAAHDAIAVVDDQEAVQCGRDLQVEVRRTLGLLATAVQAGKMSESEVVDVIRRLADRGGAMYWFDNQRHKTPHFHARYRGKEAVFDLAGMCIEGDIGGRANRLVAEWVEERRSGGAAERARGGLAVRIRRSGDSMGDTTPVALQVSTPGYATVAVTAADGMTYHADLSSFASVYCFPRTEAEWAKVSIDTEGLGLVWSTRFEVHMDQVVGLAFRREQTAGTRRAVV